MKKIRILYTINYITNGGPSRVLLNIVNNLDKNKYDISILTIIDKNDKKIVSDLKKEGINIIEFKLKKSLKSLFKNYRNIQKKIINISPDIIHTHGIVTTTIVGSSKINAYKITTIHNNIYEDYSYTYGKLKGKIFANIHLHVLKKFDQVVCCSKTSYEIIKHKFKNIDYIRNGIECNYDFKNEVVRKQIRKDLKIPIENIVYIYVGQLNKRKRVIELVNLFNKSLKENENLIIVGTGPFIDDIKKIACDKIKIVGFKNNVYDYFCAADIYTSNSSSEGFSISIIEALSSGLLLLLSDIPSHIECFEIDHNYYLGEFYGTNDFDSKKNLLISKFNRNEKESVYEFQKKYLASVIMTLEYEKYYKEGIGDKK